MDAKTLVWWVVGIWFAATLALGAAGVFVTPLGSPPLPILLGVLVPLAAFAAAYRGSAAFKALVLGADLRLLAGLQAWRFGGLWFLALWAYAVLPGLFAWPAAIGDTAVALAAPWIARSLGANPGFAASRRFVAWNLFGILDFVVALSAGALGAGLLPALTGEVTTQPMARLPLVLIPEFFVPLLLIMHIVSLLQARALASASWKPGASVAPAGA